MAGKKNKKKPTLQIRDRIVDFRRVKGKDLLSNPNNWRMHSEEQRGVLRDLLGDIGIANALIARQTQSGKLEIIDGHLRQDTNPNIEWPVLVLDVTEEEATKLLLSLDPLAGMATGNLDRLRTLMEMVEPSSEALKALWEQQIANAKRLVEFEAQNNEAADAPAPDRPARPVSKYGDVWKLGAHRLMCGDATKKSDVNDLLGKSKPGLMVTDPPYGVNYDPKWRNEAASKGLIAYACRRVGKVHNDDRIEWSDAYKFFSGAIAYIWHAGRHASEIQQSLQECGFAIRRSASVELRHPRSRDRSPWRNKHAGCFLRR